MNDIRFLVVEDDRAIRTELAEIAAELGTTDQAATLEEASRMLSEGQYRMVFVDLRLPDGSGFDLIELAMSAGHRPVVVVVSSTLNIVNRNRALELGAHDFISKPFHPAEVVMRIRRALDAGAGVSTQPSQPSQTSPTSAATKPHPGGRPGLFQRLRARRGRPRP